MSKPKYNTNDISKKKAVDPQRQAECQGWMSSITGTEYADFWADLRDGTELCELVNKIKPGTCKKFKKSNIAFVARSNIQIFIEGCKKLGVPEGDCFETRDLYDGQDLARVILNLYALSGASKKIGFTGPMIGKGYATKNKREFTKEQLAKSKSAVPGWNKGSLETKTKNMDGYGIVKTAKDMQKPSEVQGAWQKGSYANTNKNMDGYGIVKTSKDMQKPSEVQGVWQKGAKQNETKNIDGYGIVKTDKDMQKPSQVQSKWEQGAVANETTSMDSYGIVKSKDN